MIDFVILRETCKPCKTRLVRVTQKSALYGPETTMRDDVVCPECWSGGGYQSVIVESAGLHNGWTIGDDFKAQVREAVRRERAP
jgi:hypothetical protein